MVCLGAVSSAAVPEVLWEGMMVVPVPTTVAMRTSMGMHCLQAALS